MKDPACYVCQYPAGSYRDSIDNKYSVIKCSNCGLEYTDPIPADAELGTFYENYEDLRAEEKIVELNAIAHLEFLRKHGWTPNSRMLDYGAGSGIFVKVAGKNCYGVELIPGNNDRVKVSLEDFNEDSWDFITLWGVLEHLSSPKSVVRNLVARLNPSGIITFTTVSAEGIIPYYYKPPEHLTYWTRSAFAWLFNDCGLELLEFEPYFMSQYGHIYVERLLSRTPHQYQALLDSSLPEIVYVPTNEVRVSARKVIEIKS